MPRVDRECTTHHHACDCREEYFARIEKALKVAREALVEIREGSIWAKEVSVSEALAEIDRIAGVVWRDGKPFITVFGSGFQLRKRFDNGK